MSEEGIEYEGKNDNFYAIDIKYESLSDMTSITAKDISFKNMENKLSDPIYGGNGGIKIQYSNVVGAPISSITVENIVQESVNPKLGFNETLYYGVRFSNNDSIAANQISVNNVTAKGSLTGAFGMLNESTNLSYGTIKISNINGLGVYGLQTSGSKQSMSPLAEHEGTIEISEIHGHYVNGALFKQNSIGKKLEVSGVTSTKESLEQLFGKELANDINQMFGPGQATGVQIELSVDESVVENAVTFDSIGISDIHSESGEASGMNIFSGNLINNNLLVDTVSGKSSYGLNINYDSYSEETTQTKIVTIQNIGSETSNESVAAQIESNRWEGQSVTIDTVTASNQGVATGIKNHAYSGHDYKGSIVQDSIKVRNVVGGEAYGIHNSAEISDSISFTSKQINVDTVTGTKAAYGIHNNTMAKLNADFLTVKNIKADFAVALNAENNSNAEIGSATINPSNWTEYAGGYAEDPSTVESNLKSFAVRAVSGAKVLIANTSGQTADIFGTIVAGRGTTDENAMGASIVIGSNDNTVNIVGDVYAGNGGAIEITLGKDSVMEGQVDDYHEVDTLGSDAIFRNSAFVTADGTELPVTQSGSATINLNGGSWVARGQNFVKNVAFGTDGGRIDLTKNTNSSVTIENISGKGQFDMSLGAYTEGTEEIKSDMLYLKNVAKDSSFTIAAHLAEGVTVNDLAGLRFATVGSVADGHSPDLFKFVQIKDQGFNDWNLKVATEDYVSGDEDNARFNGVTNGQETYKPGEHAVDAMFGDQSTASARATPADAKNYFIESIEEGTNEDGGEPQEPEKPGEPVNPGSSISDAGQAVIATARSLYYNAVDIDRFNQRYGDRRYDDSNNSIWMRVRQDRWNTDAGVGDFESRNTTYQVGYDYTQPVASGKMIYGAAFDFMNGDTDYDSIVGSGETKRYAVSAYATYVGDNGAYLDMIGKVGRLSNEYSVRLDSGAGISADYMNWMTGLSIEAGHQFSSGDSHWFIEPQVQAQYVHVSSNDYTNGQTKIDQDSIHSFITRAGVRVGRWLDEEMNANVYAKVDVLHEWAGDQDIHVKDKTTAVNGDLFEITNDGTWFDVGLGFQAPMAKSVYAYGDVEYRFGNELDQTWTFNLGAKYVF